MRATKLACLHCGRDRTDHCDECRACWHPGVDPKDGQRLIGCPIHDGLRMVARWRYTTWQVVA